MLGLSVQELSVKKLMMRSTLVLTLLAAGSGCKVGGTTSLTTPSGGGGGGDTTTTQGGTTTASCETPQDHCLLPDDVLVSEPFKSGYVTALLGKQTAPPNSAGEATFMLLGDGSTKTSRVAYRSRRAAPADLAVGVLVAVHDATNGDGLYRSPMTRQEAMTHNWFVARIVSVDPVPQGHVLVSGGYGVLVDALRVVEGDEGPRIPTPGPEDAMFVKPDHWFVSNTELPNDGYATAHLAVAIQPPSEQTRHEGDFLLLNTGERKWFKHAWHSRAATPADIKLGAHVVVYDATRGDGVYRAPTKRVEALNGNWFIAKVTDTSESFKGVVTVSGGYRAATDGLRVLVK